MALSAGPDPSPGLRGDSFRNSPASGRGDARATLDALLLAAHAAGDVPALAGLYEEAADLARDEGLADAAAFYLTHAYVYALDVGDPRAEEFRARLKAEGREE